MSEVTRTPFDPEDGARHINEHAALHDDLNELRTTVSNLRDKLLHDGKLDRWADMKVLGALFSLADALWVFKDQVAGHIGIDEDPQVHDLPHREIVELVMPIVKRLVERENIHTIEALQARIGDILCDVADRKSDSEQGAHVAAGHEHYGVATYHQGREAAFREVQGMLEKAGFALDDSHECTEQINDVPPADDAPEEKTS